MQSSQTLVFISMQYRQHPYSNHSVAKHTHIYICTYVCVCIYNRIFALWEDVLALQNLQELPHNDDLLCWLLHMVWFPTTVYVRTLFRKSKISTKITITYQLYPNSIQWTIHLKTCWLWLRFFTGRILLAPTSISSYTLDVLVMVQRYIIQIIHPCGWTKKFACLRHGWTKKFAFRFREELWELECKLWCERSKSDTCIYIYTTSS